MDRETQARIFEPFFTTKEKAKAPASVCSTVYGIIKQSGGYVFVQSEIGRGTVFTIYFPRVDEPTEALGTVPAALAATGGSKPSCWSKTRDGSPAHPRNSRIRGYHVLEAGDGRAALALAASRSETIHLVITDVVMPGLSGHELVQQLLGARPPLKSLPLRHAEETVAGPLAPKVPKPFSQKPFTCRTLRKVREVLGAASN